MEEVGDAKKRNAEFNRSFDRSKLLRSVVDTDSPVILDIGAHKGESVSYLMKVFPGAFIYSLEPDPDSYQALLSKQFQNHRCLNLAVSNVDSTITFYKNDISHTSSLFKVNSKSRDSIAIQAALQNNDLSLFESFNREITVKAVTLDSLMRDEGIAAIDLLKIDVQGAESLVLEGGRQCLQITKAVLLEISFFDYYEKRTSFFEIEHHLRPSGFELFSIGELSQNPMNGRTDWAEVLYVKARPQ